MIFCCCVLCRYEMFEKIFGNLILFCSYDIMYLNENRFRYEYFKNIGILMKSK